MPRPPKFELPDFEAERLIVENKKLLETQAILVREVTALRPVYDAVCGQNEERLATALREAGEALLSPRTHTCENEEWRRMVIHYCDWAHTSGCFMEDIYRYFRTDRKTVARWRDLYSLRNQSLEASKRRKSTSGELRSTSLAEFFLHAPAPRLKPEDYHKDPAPAIVPGIDNRPHRVPSGEQIVERQRFRVVEDLEEDE